MKDVNLTDNNLKSRLKINYFNYIMGWLCHFKHLNISFEQWALHWFQPYKFEYWLIAFQFQFCFNNPFITSNYFVFDLQENICVSMSLTGIVLILFYRHGVSSMFFFSIVLNQTYVFIKLSVESTKIPQLNELSFFI